MAGEEGQFEEATIDPVVVTVVDDAAAKDGGKVAAGNEAADPAEDLKSQYEALRKRTESAETRAAQAERVARDAVTRAEQVSTVSAEAQYDSVVAGLDAAQSDLERLQRDAATAAETGDFHAQAKANAEIGKLGYRIGRLEEAKADMEARRESGKQERTQPRQEQLDPVEAFARTRTAASAEWIRAHPDYVTDVRKNTKLSAAHFDAEDKGLTVDTPEYFEHIEQYVGLKQPTADAPQKQQQQQKKTPARPAVAPVGHRAGSNGNGTVRRVELTRSEAASATDGTIVWNYDDPSPQKRFKKGEPIGVNEFARRKSLMSETGAYDRTYTDE